ncbi:MAG: ribonuclease Z [Bacteroidales bacterium]|nr:ribonuclease Z [Bacteroidales bacterium]
MNFTLTIMGTASAMPISDRNPSAQMLAVHGRLFLLDCGEGTQQQMRRAHLSFMKVEAIFISHIHGDHLFGLFGLLNTMTMYGRTAPLYIYGPQALGSVLNFYKSFFGEWDGYEIKFTAVDCREPQLIHTSKHVTVSAFPLRHKIECYGYRFNEIVTERHKQENPDYHPKSYAYCSDTVPFPEEAEWVRGVDLLYHEATYPQEMADKAVARWHSTARQAAECARDAGAGRLAIGHYSSRITDFDALLQECRDVFPDTLAAQDGDVIDF